jgi:hypothetical protein
MTFSLFEPSSPEARLCFLGPVTHSLLDTMREALKNQTQKSALIGAAIFGRYHALNRYLLELLRRSGEGARRLASAITHNNDKRERDIPLIDVEITESENALCSVQNRGCSRCQRGRIAIRQAVSGVI